MVCMLVIFCLRCVWYLDSRCFKIFDWSLFFLIWIFRLEIAGCLVCIFFILENGLFACWGIWLFCSMVVWKGLFISCDVCMIFCKIADWKGLGGCWGCKRVECENSCCGVDIGLYSVILFWVLSHCIPFILFDCWRLISCICCCSGLCDDEAIVKSTTLRFLWVNGFVGEVTGPGWLISLTDDYWKWDKIWATICTESSSAFSRRTHHFPSLGHLPCGLGVEKRCIVCLGSCNFVTGAVIAGEKQLVGGEKRSLFYT